MKKYDMVYPQNYTINGEEKTRWINCGAVFETDKGMSCKLESIPVGVATDDGGLWLRFFEPKARENKESPF